MQTGHGLNVLGTGPYKQQITGRAASWLELGKCGAEGDREDSLRSELCEVYLYQSPQCAGRRVSLNRWCSVMLGRFADSISGWELAETQTGLRWRQLKSPIVESFTVLHWWHHLSVSPRLYFCVKGILMGFKT